MEHHEVSDINQITVRSLKSKLLKNDSPVADSSSMRLLSYLVQCEASALPPDVLQGLVAALCGAAGEHDCLLDVPLSFTLFSRAIVEEVSDAARNPEWWPAGTFAHNGLATWQNTRAKWQVRLQPRYAIMPYCYSTQCLKMS